MSENSGQKADVREQMPEAKATAGLKSGQSNLKRNFGLVLQINVFIFVLKSEYRILNIES